MVNILLYSDIRLSYIHGKYVQTATFIKELVVPYILWLRSLAVTKKTFYKSSLSKEKKKKIKLTSQSLKDVLILTLLADSYMGLHKANELVDLQILPSEVITAFSSESHSDFLQTELLKTHSESGPLLFTAVVAWSASPLWKVLGVHLAVSNTLHCCF